MLFSPYFYLYLVSDRDVPGARPLKELWTKSKRFLLLTLSEGGDVAQVLQENFVNLGNDINRVSRQKKIMT